MRMNKRFTLISIALGMLLAVFTAGAKPRNCSVDGVRFACPKNFRAVQLEPTQKFALYYWKKYEVGLFIASPPANSDEGALIIEMKEISLAKMFPKEPHGFAWKAVENPGRRISKYEIENGEQLGFNETRTVLIKYRILKFNGRDTIVGYASDFGQGDEGKEAFNRGLGGDSMPGCYALVDTIYSITGEKMPENNPCDLIATIE